MELRVNLNERLYTTLQEIVDEINRRHPEEKLTIEDLTIKTLAFIASLRPFILDTLSKPKHEPSTRKDINLEEWTYEDFMKFFEETVRRGGESPADKTLSFWIAFSGLCMRYTFDIIDKYFKKYIEHQMNYYLTSG